MSQPLTGEHWFRLMLASHGRFCWTMRPCSVMLLRRGIFWSLGGDYDMAPLAMSLW
jgi:hypothetical protein